VLDAHEHYELAFSPYDDDYAYPFLVTTRDSVSDPRHRPWRPCGVVRAPARARRGRHSAFTKRVGLSSDRFAA